MLSGQPKGGVPVEARSESKGYFEETVTNSAGNYRLRGLLPDTTYVIKVAKRDGVESSGIERASPDSISVKVSSCYPFVLALSMCKLGYITSCLMFPGWN